MDPVDRWLERHIPISATRRGTVLVLCRTRSTASLVRHWVARQGGISGLEVSTPSGLAMQAWQPPLAKAVASTIEAQLPPESAISARVGPRPGLVALLRRHLNALRLTRLARPSIRGRRATEADSKHRFPVL
ncbi:MAG: hypothetical protein HN348_11475, partial [Proteobacteria bacterium]|nr:hypothetical protein [Pseudomonadota bacterium]